MKNIKIFIFLFLIGLFSTFAQDKKFITYKVVEGETIQSISIKFSITPYDLLKLNPDISNKVNTNDIIIIPNKDYNPEKDVTNTDLSHISERDIIVDNFVYHEVIQKETIYSLLKKFKVTIDELNRINPFLINDGLEHGQVLKIPLYITESDIEEKNKSTQPYLVKPKETKYSIARNFGISIDYLEELNPKIKRDGLQIDDVIIVPKKTIENTDNDFIIYKVEKLETFYSLSNKFGLSSEELIATNPELTDGVIEGMLLRIPNAKKDNKEMFLDEILEGKKLNVAMMLPFRTKIDSLDFENDRLLNITTDFYFGALMAVNSLKKEGLSIQMKVFDTENSKSVSKKLSANNEFVNYDVVIGPMFLDNVKAVSNNLNNKKALIISPISSKDHSQIQNNNLVQGVCSQESLTLEMIEYIKSIYVDQKIIVITDEVKEGDIKYKEVFKRIQLLDSTQIITVLRPDEGYIKPGIFRESMSENEENWVLLLGKDETFVRDVFNNLGVLPEEINITLFTFNKGRSYDKISNYFFSRVNLHYPTSTYIDYNAVDYLDFEKNYKKSFYSYPTKYAVEGFDITYDILMRLATNSDLINQGISKRIASKYNFVENTSGSIINQGVFIIKYDGLELKVVE